MGQKCGGLEELVHPTHVLNFLRDNVEFIR